MGHIELHTNQLDASDRCMQKIGLRPIFRNESVSILELRGGTHLVLVEDNDHRPGEADFDLMVEDIDVTYKQFQELDLNVSEMQRGTIHDSFTLVEPGGNSIRVNSTHVSDQPV